MPDVDVFKSNIALRQIEANMREEEEKKRKALDIKRLNKMKQKNLPQAIQQTDKDNTKELLQLNTRISLPAPNISDSELHNISKFAGSGLAMKD